MNVFNFIAITTEDILSPVNFLLMCDIEHYGIDHFYRKTKFKNLVPIGRSSLYGNTNGNGTINLSFQVSQKMVTVQFQQKVSTPHERAGHYPILWNIHPKNRMISNVRFPIFLDKHKNTSKSTLNEIMGHTFSFDEFKEQLSYIILSDSNRLPIEFDRINF